MALSDRFIMALRKRARRMPEVEDEVRALADKAWELCQKGNGEKVFYRTGTYQGKTIGREAQMTCFEMLTAMEETLEGLHDEPASGLTIADLSGVSR